MHVVSIIPMCVDKISGGSQVKTPKDLFLTVLDICILRYSFVYEGKNSYVKDFS